MDNNGLSMFMGSVYLVNRDYDNLLFFARMNSKHSNSLIRHFAQLNDSACSSTVNCSNTSQQLSTRFAIGLTTAPRCSLGHHCHWGPRGSNVGGGMWMLGSNGWCKTWICWEEDFHNGESTGEMDGFMTFKKKTKRVPSANPSIASQKIDANGKNSCIVVNDVSIFFCAKKMITHCETMAFQSRIWHPCFWPTQWDLIPSGKR